MGLGATSAARMEEKRQHRIRALLRIKTYMTRLIYYPAIVAVSAMISFDSAAQEITLLTLESDLIGEIGGLALDAPASEVINRYYGLLPESIQTMLLHYNEQLATLMTDYEVARTAADSAEITEVISDMDAAWIEIQKIHSDSFTSVVTGMLHIAYSQLYPVL